MSKIEIILFLTSIAGLTSTFILYKKQNKKPAAITYIDVTGERK